jgi:hypothetical protein
MNNTLLLTLGIAFVVVVLSMALMGISWLLTGKLKIKPGACGRDPNKKRDEECGTDVDCQLCKKNDDEKSC